MQVAQVPRDRSLLLIIPRKEKLEDGLMELKWDCDTDVLDIGQEDAFQEVAVNVVDKEGWDVAAKDDNDHYIPKQEGGSSFSDDYESAKDSPCRPPPIFNEEDDDQISDEEVVVDRGCGRGRRLATRPHARQPTNLRYRPPSVRGVTSQPQVQKPIRRPASVVDPIGTNMTFMLTPGFRVLPPPNP
ncbi:protein-L-isoaspartate O-methyltransferase [Sesbania bispinosa]|nr:protein-L-isoaspartate O-methyltransferase [Sesbania bispinosa]